MREILTDDDPMHIADSQVGDLECAPTSSEERDHGRNFALWVTLAAIASAAILCLF